MCDACPTRGRARGCSGIIWLPETRCARDLLRTVAMSGHMRRMTCVTCAVGVSRPAALVWRGGRVLSFLSSCPGTQ
eukprot:6868140-Prymnesium_polylepis.1